jgi:hypothetical protein
MVEKGKSLFYETGKAMVAEHPMCPVILEQVFDDWNVRVFYKYENG